MPGTLLILASNRVVNCSNSHPNYGHCSQCYFKNSECAFRLQILFFTRLVTTDLIWAQLPINNTVNKSTDVILKQSIQNHALHTRQMASWPLFPPHYISIYVFFLSSTILVSFCPLLYVIQWAFAFMFSQIRYYTNLETKKTASTFSSVLRFNSIT